MSDQLPKARGDQGPGTPPYLPSDSGWDRQHVEGRQDHQHPDDSPTGHGGHRWMMIACCIPMLVIVGILVATGIAGTGVIIFAVVCLGVMTLMMLAMSGGHGR